MILPAMRIDDFSGFITRPEIAVKSSIVAKIPRSDAGSPLGKTIMSSAKLRWVRFISEQVGWKPIFHAKAAFFSRRDITFIAITKRYRDRAHPCLKPLVLGKKPSPKQRKQQLIGKYGSNARTSQECSLLAGCLR